MSHPEPEELFRRYRDCGDVNALGRVFDLCAEEILRVALHLSRNTDEAEDLLQSTFLTAMESPESFEEGRRLVPWLLGILSNKLRMNRRREAQDMRSRQLVPSASVDPVRIAEDRELLDRLESVLLSISPVLRSVLVLHLQHGLGAHEIARALDRPKGTVRSQISRGMEEVRRRLPVTFTSMTAAVLLSREALARVRSTITSTGDGLLGGSQLLGSLMTLKTNTAVTSLVVFALIALWAFGPWASGPVESEPNDTVAMTQVKSPALDAQSEVDSVPGERASVEPRADPAQAEGTAELVVEVVWHDGTPAHGIEVVLVEDSESRNSRNWYLNRKLAKSNRGEARFSGLDSGRVEVFLWQDVFGKAVVSVDLTAGLITRATLTVPRGVDVAGVVQDPQGEPVPGAIVLLGYAEGSHPVAVTDGAGRFSLRSAPSHLYVSARAPGYWFAIWPQVKHLIDPQRVVLKLRSGGGTLKGAVRDVTGQPISGAVVRTGRTPMPISVKIRGELPAETTTDAYGQFAIDGSLDSMYGVLVFVSAPGFAVWRGDQRLSRGLEEHLVITLERGVSLRGRIARDDSGSVVGTRVTVAHSLSNPGMAYQGPSWARPSSDVTDDGYFVFEGLPPGKISIIATAKAGDGSAMAQFVAEPGAALEWNPVLANRRIHGRLTDSQGKALAGWKLAAIPAATGMAVRSASASAKTDKEGAFAIDACLDVEHVVAVECLKRTRQSFTRTAIVHQFLAVRPSQQAVTLVIPIDRMPNAKIRGWLEVSAGEEVMLSLNDMRGMSVVLRLGSGEFIVPDLCSGRYWITLTSSSRGRMRLDPIDLGADEDHQLGTIEWPETGLIEVSAVDQAGRPVALDSILLQRVDGRDFLGIGSSEPVRVAPGRWIATDITNGSCMRSEPVLVRSGNTTQLCLVEQPSSRRRIRFDDGGLTRMVYSVAWRDVEDRVWLRQTQPSFSGGSVARTLSLPIGVHTVEVTRPDGVRRTTQIEVTAEDSDRVIDIAVR